MMQVSTAQPNSQPAHAELDAEQARLFQCSTCKRSFTRADHLTRHVRARKSLSLLPAPVVERDMWDALATNVFGAPQTSGIHFKEFTAPVCYEACSA